MWILSKLIQSGDHVYCHLTADSETELQHAARRLKVQVHGTNGKGRFPHLDLNERKRELAIKYGAIEQEACHAST